MNNGFAILASELLIGMDLYNSKSATLGISYCSSHVTAIDAPVGVHCMYAWYKHAQTNTHTYTHTHRQTHTHTHTHTHSIYSGPPIP